MFGTKTISWCIFRCGRRVATTPLSGFATSQGLDHMKSGVSDQEKWRGLIISWICGALFVLIMIDQKVRKLWPSSLQVCTSAEGRSEQAVFLCSLFSCWHGICILPPCPVCHRAYFYCIFGSSIRSRWPIHPLPARAVFSLNGCQISCKTVYKYMMIMLLACCGCVWCKSIVEILLRGLCECWLMSKHMCRLVKDSL